MVRVMRDNTELHVNTVYTERYVYTELRYHREPGGFRQH